jgi:hypothetical protein
MRLLLLALALMGSVSLSAATDTYTPTNTPTNTNTPTFTPTFTSTPTPRAQQQYNYGGAARGNYSITQRGGSLKDGCSVALGYSVGEEANIAAPFNAGPWGGLTAGEVVKFTTTSNTVTRTSAALEVGALGVCVSTQSFQNAPVYVAIAGIVEVASAVNGVAGSLYVSSGTAGKVTLASSIADATVALYTPLSPSVKLRCLESKTISATDYKIRALILQ